MRFTGTIEAKADTKGRVFFPAAFRRVLGDGEDERLVLAKDAFQPCLVVYPWSVWNAQVDELSGRLSRWNAAHRSLFRQFVSDVEVFTLDTNGRFLIPKRYAQMAGISQDVVFLGMDDTVEVWSKLQFAAHNMPAADFAKQLEEIMSSQP